MALRKARKGKRTRILKNRQPDDVLTQVCPDALFLGSIFNVFSDDHIFWTETSSSFKIYKQVPVHPLMITKKLTRMRLEYTLPNPNCLNQKPFGQLSSVDNK